MIERQCSDFDDQQQQFQNEDSGTMVIHDDDKENYDTNTPIYDQMMKNNETGTLIIKSVENDEMSLSEEECEPVKKINENPFLKKRCEVLDNEFPEELKGLSIRMIEENIKVINNEREKELNFIKKKFDNIISKHELAIRLLKKEIKAIIS